ncbi:MAG TPA: RNA polymerase sigma factor, partial [Trueperaceae bacterium]|nr:RNA polymerase sigma factor [Trueperaceae bacterium]
MRAQTVVLRRPRFGVARDRTESMPDASKARALPAQVAGSEPEGELVALAVAGDEAAFEKIMRRHNQLLFRTARSILKSDEGAEEAVQDAFLRAWLALDSFRAESKLSTWLVRIVTNEALGRLRRAKIHTIPLDDAMTSPDPKMQLALADTPSHGPEQSTQRAQLRAVIEQQIDLLPDDFRTVFMLRDVEGLAARDVAEALGIPVATVRTRGFRARKLLREGL